MKIVKVSFHPVRDNEVVTGTILKQRKRNDYWVNEESIVVNSDDAGAERQLMLEDNQRIVVEAASNIKMVYDREQRASVPVASKDPLPPSTPQNTDGDESPPTLAVELAMRGQNAQKLAEQEARDKAISDARDKLKKQQQQEAQNMGKAHDQKEETKSTHTQSPAHPTEPGATVQAPPPPPKKDDKEPSQPTTPSKPAPFKALWPPQPKGTNK